MKKNDTLRCEKWYIPLNFGPSWNSGELEWHSKMLEIIQKKNSKENLMFFSKTVGCEKNLKKQNQKKMFIQKPWILFSAKILVKKNDTLGCE